MFIIVEISEENIIEKKTREMDKTEKALDMVDCIDLDKDSDIHGEKNLTIIAILVMLL